MPSVRRIVLGVFAAWHGLAAAKNLCELLAAFDVVPGAARFGSKNLPAMEKLLASLHPSTEVLGVLLTGVIGLETSVAVASTRGDEERAFALALLLFGAFVLIDDAFVDYRLDETHRGILTLLLVGYLVVRET
jgi:hypothetical protein